MSMDHPQAEELHRYFDGELQTRRAGQVRAHVEQCERCSTEIEGLTKLHGLVQMAAEQAADALHPDALFARISAGLDTKPEPSLGERLAMWWEALLEPWQPRGVWAPATIAVAVGAALLLLARPAHAPNGGDAVAGRSPAPASEPHAAGPVSEASAPPSPAPVLRSEIVQVDFGTNAGTVFEIALGATSSTPVVWINDEEEEE